MARGKVVSSVVAQTLKPSVAGGAVIGTVAIRPVNEAQPKLAAGITPIISAMIKDGVPRDMAVKDVTAAAVSTVNPATNKPKTVKEVADSLILTVNEMVKNGMPEPVAIKYALSSASAGANAFNARPFPREGSRK